MALREPGSKITALVLDWGVEDSAARSDTRVFGSELADHSRSAPLLRLFGNGWAPFFVADSLVQDQPNQPTLSMGNGSDGLIMC